MAFRKTDTMDLLKKEKQGAEETIAKDYCWAITDTPDITNADALTTEPGPSEKAACLTAQVVLSEIEVESMLKAREKNHRYLNHELRIALIGKTGVGKSATANTIIGEKHFKSSIGLSAVTQTCAEKHTTVLGRKVLVVDTPGIFDTETDPDLIQQEIQRCISIASPGPHAILFVMTLSDRYKIEDYEAFVTFCSYFGEKMLDHIIAVFTHADTLQSQGITLEQCLENSPNKLKELLKHFGNRKIAFNNNCNNKVESEHQVECLLTIIESLKAGNVIKYYNDKNFQQAESEIKDRELEIENKLKKEYEVKYKKIRETCKEEFDNKLQAIQRDCEKKVSEVRKTIRRAFAQYEKQSKTKDIFVQGIEFKLKDRRSEIEKKIPQPERRGRQEPKQKGDDKLETRCTEVDQK